MSIIVFQVVTNNTKLFFAKEDMKFRAKSYLCFLHGLSPGHERATRCKNVVGWAESHHWWSKGLGSGGGVDSHSAIARGGRECSSSIRERQCQAGATALAKPEDGDEESLYQTSPHQL